MGHRIARDQSRVHAGYPLLGRRKADTQVHGSRKPWSPWTYWLFLAVCLLMDPSRELRLLHWTAGDLTILPRPSTYNGESKEPELSCPPTFPLGTCTPTLDDIILFWQTSDCGLSGSACADH